MPMKYTLSRFKRVVLLRRTIVSLFFILVLYFNIVIIVPSTTLQYFHHTSDERALVYSLPGSQSSGTQCKMHGSSRDERRLYSSSRVHTPVSSLGFPNRAANRSPPRPSVPFQNGSNNMITLVNTTYSNINCWTVDGELCTAPSWAPALFTAATPSTSSSSLALLKKLAHVANTDPWQVIMVWVPERFMGIQKNGRKADGSVMIPPTLGRNPETYWREYNASWHWGYTPSSDITAADGGNGGDRNKYTYQMQLMHRNSIAVCIRERLHLRMVYLSVAPSESSREGAHDVNSNGIDNIVLPVHYCHCRHCQEEVLSNGYKAKAPLSVVHPDYISPLTSAGGAIVPPVKVWHANSNGGSSEIYASDSSVEDVSESSEKSNRTSEACLRVEAAPWLIPTTDSFTFPYEPGRKEAAKAHDYSDLDALLRIRADPNGVIMVVFFNKFWIDHLHNFIFSLVNRAKYDHFIVATTDSEALSLCIDNRLPCFDATMYAELEEDTIPNIPKLSNKSGSGFVKKVTEEISWIKPRLGLAVLQRGFHFLMSDLDITFNDNPIDDLLATNVDIAHQCDSKSMLSINSGFYLARSNPRTIRFFHNTMVFSPQESSDQTAMRLFVKYDHTHGVSNICLDRKKFSMKCYYKVEGSRKIINKKETFQWMTFNRERKDFTWNLHHATCLAGALNKIVYLRTINAWFLDDLDAHTNTYTGHVDAQKYCLAFPDGPEMNDSSEEGGFNRNVKMQKKYIKKYVGTLQTKHSPKYTKDTDSSFLSHRH